MQKESHKTKYLDAESRQYLAEIRNRYDKWKTSNEALKGPFLDSDSKSTTKILTARVKLFNDYKDFIDQQHYAENFDSRSNLHSSVLEEFMFYLFSDLVAGFSKSVLIGKAHAYKDLFFQAPNFKEMVSKPFVKIEKKDHDFVIGVNIEASFHCKGNEYILTEKFQIPAVAIECKTYLDKTMLEGSSTAAEQLIHKNPNGMYLVVAEWLKLTSKVNLKKYKVDQIYVLRKQKNTDREYRYLDRYVKNPIYADVVEHLFKTVKEHLTDDWREGVHHGLDLGYLK